MKLEVSGQNVVVPASLLANLSLLERLLHAARCRFAALKKQLAELQDQASAPRSIELRADDRKRTGRLTVVAAVAGDIIELVKKMDQLAEQMLSESRQLWDSFEFVSGNVHKVAFGRLRLVGGVTRVERTAGAVDDRLRQLPHLAISLVEQASLLEETVADLMLV